MAPLVDHVTRVGAREARPARADALPIAPEINLPLAIFIIGRVPAAQVHLISDAKLFQHRQGGGAWRGVAGRRRGCGPGGSGRAPHSQPAGQRRISYRLRLEGCHSLP